MQRLRDICLSSNPGLVVYKTKSWDFPGGPVVKISHSNAVGRGLIPGRGAKIPYASGPKTQNIKKEATL